MKLNLQSFRAGEFSFEFFRTIGYQASSGGEIGECMAVIEKIRDNDFRSWTSEWTAVADKTKQKAEDFKYDGEPISAGETFLRASNYYRAAGFFVSPTSLEHKRLWEESRGCFQKAIPFLSFRIEKLGIPFEGSTIPGYFIKSGDGIRPTLMAVSGFDGSGEELYHEIGVATAKYGWNCLIFEGPGQGGALHLNPALKFRPDYERPVSAVVDYAISRDDVDPQRLALIGFSMGGYLAPRAAAHDSRIKACIANCLLVDMGSVARAELPAFLMKLPHNLIAGMLQVFMRVKPSLRWIYDHFCWAYGISHPSEMFSAMDPYSLKGTEKLMKAPLLCIFGELEFKIGAKVYPLDVFHYIDQLQSPVEMCLFTQQEGGASHCQVMGGLQQMQAAVFHWLNEVLPDKSRVSAGNDKPRVVMPKVFPDVIGRYYGKSIGQLYRKFLR
jgi:pimeloyl-ACP methyl ester carboxylesterase